MRVVKWASGYEVQEYFDHLGWASAEWFDTYEQAEGYILNNGFGVVLAVGVV